MSSYSKSLSPLFITSLSYHSGVWDTLGRGNLGALTSAGYVSANLGLFFPVRLQWEFQVNRVFVTNGGTASGNFDIGIYSAGLTRIYSTGSTAQVGTNVNQYVTPATPFKLPPGSYYLAIVMNGTTNTAFRTTGPTAQDFRSVGCFQMASAFALPATATPATYANAYAPLFGITKTTSGF